MENTAINLKCSACGGKVEVTQLTCDPPITRYTCQTCGKIKEVNPRQIEVTIKMEPAVNKL